jgi:uncharacterized SAM-binding protein YcdF (DUF218 family)
VKRTAVTAPEGSVSRLFRLLRIGIGLGALLVAFVAATLFLFVFPHTDPPGHADAVVVLSGGGNGRLNPALRLMDEGVAPTLAISGAGLDPKYLKAKRLCAHHPSGYRLICFDPKPYSTVGEAEAIARMARSHGWRRVVAVTSTYHVYRARMLIKRCYHGGLAMVGTSYPLRDVVPFVASEWAKLIYHLTVKRSC